MSQMMQEWSREPVTSMWYEFETAIHVTKVMGKYQLKYSKVFN